MIKNIMFIFSPSDTTQAICETNGIGDIKFNIFNVVFITLLI